MPIRTFSALTEIFGELFGMVGSNAGCGLRAMGSVKNGEGCAANANILLKQNKL